MEIESSAKRVLVVDDDPDVLRTVMRMLDRHVEVKIALGADQALQVLGGGTIDAVVVDFNMHGPNGGWLLRQVRDRYPAVSRVLLSGSSYADLSPHLEPGLVDVFLAKPFEFEELLASVG
jgi:DNA-binding NtrC family response regulator